MRIARATIVAAALIALIACAGGAGSVDDSVILADAGSVDSSVAENDAAASCPEGKKSCDGTCVAENDPKYGCTKSGCKPCTTGGKLSALCQFGTCAYQDCTNGGDCDGDPGNGCETLIFADPKNCGGCGIACSYASGKGTCQNKVCADLGCDKGGWSDCNGNAADGCEVQTGGTDKANCGACGRTCASCTGGLCDGDLVANTGNYTTPVALVRDGTTLYVAIQPNGGGGARIATVPTSGGTLTDLLAADGGHVAELLVDGTTLFVADNDGRIYKLPTTGVCAAPGCPTVMASARKFPRAIAVDDTYVYWIESGGFQQDDGGFYRKRKDDTGAIEPLGSFPKFPTRLLHDGTSFFIGSELGNLEKVTADGLTTTPVENAQGVAIGGGTVGFAAVGTELFTSTATLASGSIQAIPKAGGASRSVGTIPAEAIVPDGDMLYATSQLGEDPRTVFVIPTSGTCTPKSPCPLKLAKYSYSTGDYIHQPLAVDATSIYFLESIYMAPNGGAIRKVAKP